MQNDPIGNLNLTLVNAIKIYDTVCLHEDELV